jgi:hypothetical protein
MVILSPKTTATSCEAHSFSILARLLGVAQPAATFTTHGKDAKLHATPHVQSTKRAFVTRGEIK